MKILVNFSFALTMLFVLAACGSSDLGENVVATEAKEVKQGVIQSSSINIDAVNSLVEWVGAKPTGEHNGTVNLKNGEFLIQDGELVGGSFVMNMTSIKNIDLEDQEWNQKLVNHLHSADFFNTTEFPEATFEITGIDPYQGEVEAGEWKPTHMVTGNLTIKNISKSITFKAQVNHDGDQIEAYSEPFAIDRAEWDIQYKSKSFFNDLKDEFINDEIGITIKIRSTKA